MINKGGVMELCYANNPKSLFRKYARFVTWFANTSVGRDYLLHNNLYLPKNVSVLLPNGYIEQEGKQAKLTVSTRAIYAPRLYPALQALEFFQGSFREAQELLLWYVGLRGQPSWATNKLYATLTAYPDANPETTSVDGRVARTGVSEAWSTIRSGAGTDADDSTDGTGGVGIRMYSSATEGGAGKLQQIYRMITLFDTSALTEGATGVSGTFSMYGNSRNISLVNFNTAVVLTAPASNTGLSSSDYNIANWTMTKQSDTNTAANSLSVVGYNDYALNSTGNGNISLTGITKLGYVSENDQANTNPNYNSNSQDDRVGFYLSDNGSNKPKLTITYTPAPTGSFMYFTQ